MDLSRRKLLTAAGAGVLAMPASAAPLSKFGLNASEFGLAPGGPGDQTIALQRAIDRSAQTRSPLILEPGVYRAGNLKLPTGAWISGVRGATRILLSQGHSLIGSDRASDVTLTGLILDGIGQTLPEGRGLVHLNTTRRLRIADCQVLQIGGIGIALVASDGEVTNNTISDASDTALFSTNGRGLLIAENIIRGSGNGGIRVWQDNQRDDGSTIVDNTIENTGARSGGTGQNGNAINVYRAANVIVRGNHIRNAAFSAVRGNAAFNIQIIGNNCSGLDEVAIYSEFGFEGAIIADNVVDGAGVGVSVTNFDDGGRLASVRGNIFRNLGPVRPATPRPEEGFGINVEADTAVTGNVIENATNAGIRAGWGKFLRDVTVTGNIVRQARHGVAVSVLAGAGRAVIASNMIAGASQGAIVGMEFHKVVTGDLAVKGASRYPKLKIQGNQVS